MRLFLNLCFTCLINSKVFCSCTDVQAFRMRRPTWRGDHEI